VKSDELSLGEWWAKGYEIMGCSCVIIEGMMNR
jgi:hypothetical protein